RPSWSLLGAQPRPLPGREECRGLGRTGPEDGIAWASGAITSYCTGKMHSRSHLSISSAPHARWMEAAEELGRDAPAQGLLNSQGVAVRNTPKNFCDILVASCCLSGLGLIGRALWFLLD
ncbi:mCG140643, partial [Mus musculus]